MSKRISALAILVALSLSLTAQAHDNIFNPGHQRGLEVDAISERNRGSFCIVFKESSVECPEKYNNLRGCAYKCLYRVWADWSDDRGSGREVDHNWSRCHIAGSHNPALAAAEVRIPKPHWATGAWGAYVRAGDDGERT